MKTKKLITYALLAFVAVSIGYLVLSNSQLQESPGPRSGITPPVNESPDETLAEETAAVMPVAAVPLAAVALSEDRVVAQYFHGTTRCVTCIAIEELTREALGSGFSEELRTGKLELRSINVDEPANGHFVEDYQLATRTVVIARFKDGKQGEWKRLDQVWQLVRDREAFINYIQAETRSLLEQSS